MDSAIIEAQRWPHFRGPILSLRADPVMVETEERTETVRTWKEPREKQPRDETGQNGQEGGGEQML